MADTNRVSIAHCVESVWGTTPGTPTFVKVRPTGESLKKNTQTVTSNEFRDDRRPTGAVRVQVGAGGGVQGELSYGTWDTFFLSLLGQDAWNADLGISGSDIQAVAATNKFVSAATSFATIGAGEWFHVAGLSNAANNGWHKAASAGTATEIEVDSQSDLVDEAAGNAVTITGTTLGIGTTTKSMTLEKAFNDTGAYFSYPGAVVNGFNLNAQNGQIVTVGWDFLARNEVPAGATLASSTTPANTNPIFNVIDHFETLWEGGLEAALKVQSLQLQVSPNVRLKYAFGDAAAWGAGLGELAITGSLSAYFEDVSLYEKYTNFTDTRIAFSLRDTAGNGYLFDVCGANYHDGQVLAQGKNGDCMAELQFTARIDANTEAFQVAKRAA